MNTFAFAVFFISQAGLTMTMPMLQRQSSKHENPTTILLKAMEPTKSTGAFTDSKPKRSTTGVDDQNDELSTLLVLQSLAAEMKTILLKLTSESQTVQWRCPPTSTDIRKRVHFRWTLTTVDTLGSQEAQRVQSWIRFRGYQSFLSTATSIGSARFIYGNAGFDGLTNATGSIQTMVYQLELLHPAVRQILDQNIQKSNGQHYLQRLAQSSTAPNRFIRHLTCLAIEDMSETFSRFNVTDSSVTLDA